MTVPLPVAAEAPVERAVDLNLRKLVMGRLNSRRAIPRKHGHHPSGLSKMCPVLYYFTEQARLGLAGPNPRPHFEFLLQTLDADAKQFPGRLRLEFEVGDAIHQMVQFHLGVNGVLYGRWMCPRCERRTAYGQMPRITIPGINGTVILDGAPCTGCGGLNRREKHSWLYMEPKVISEEWGVDGRCDGDLRVGRGEVEYRAALEIKSINEYGWSEGKKPPWTDSALNDGWTPPAGWRPPLPAKPLPKEEHVTQASTYAWLMEAPWLYFIYVNKGQVSRWKERMERPNAEAIRETQAKMHAANTGIAKKQPPLHARICPDPREKTARECPALEPCFGCKPAPNLWDASAQVFDTPSA